MYNLFYDEFKQLMISISADPDKYSHPSIEITEEEKKEVMEKLNAGKLVKVIDNSIVYEIDVFKELEKIREWRKPYLDEITPYLLEEYKTKRNFTTEEVNQIIVYYYELLDVVQAFHNCEDKESFSIVFTDELDVNVSTNDTYFLHKPYFVY